MVKNPQQQGEIAAITLAEVGISGATAHFGAPRLHKDRDNDRNCDQEPNFTWNTGSGCPIPRRCCKHEKPRQDRQDQPRPRPGKNLSRQVP